jgi:hypothetical protein
VGRDAAEDKGTDPIPLRGAAQHTADCSYKDD